MNTQHLAFGWVFTIGLLLAGCGESEPAATPGDANATTNAPVADSDQSQGTTQAAPTSQAKRVTDPAVASVPTVVAAKDVSEPTGTAVTSQVSGNRLYGAERTWLGIFGLLFLVGMVWIFERKSQNQDTAQRDQGAGSGASAAPAVGSGIAATSTRASAAAVSAKGPAHGTGPQYMGLAGSRWAKRRS